MGETEVKELKVEGDTGTGMLGDEAINFRKIDGRWYVEMPLD